MHRENRSPSASSSSTVHTFPSFFLTSPYFRFISFSSCLLPFTRSCTSHPHRVQPAWQINKPVEHKQFKTVRQQHPVTVASWRTLPLNICSFQASLRSSLKGGRLTQTYSSQMCTCWLHVCVYFWLLCACRSMYKSMTLFQQQMLIHIHALVSLVTTGHHLSHFFVKGHPRPSCREFPPSPFCGSHTPTHMGRCVQTCTASHKHSFTPPAYESLHQHVAGGCE